jgi:ubiquinone/menaquinone biosynthesis C-methylase UbiE
MTSSAYQQAWMRESSLDALNGRIHDGVPVEELADRAADRRDTFFERLFPYAAPKKRSRVLELGQGVGWIMEAMLQKYPIAEIVGLDISPTMIARAQERWQDPRASYVEYDGLHVPIDDESFDNVYSVACIQHIEKHHAFLVLKELMRVLKPGGHATLHFLSIHHLKGDRAKAYDAECWKHVEGSGEHWHHYYSYDELYVIFLEALGASDLDIKYHKTSFWLHASKGTKHPVHDPEVAAQYFLNRDVPASIRLPKVKQER